MQRYGRQSPPLSSPWPAPSRRPASVALGSVKDAGDFTPSPRISTGHQYSVAMGPGGASAGGPHSGGDGIQQSGSRPSLRPTSTYGGYSGLSSLNQDAGSGGGGGRGSGGGDGGGGSEGVGGGGGGGGQDDSTFRERVNQVVQVRFLL